MSPESLCGPVMIGNPQSLPGGEASQYTGWDPSCTVTPRDSNKQWPEGLIRVQVLFCSAFQRGLNPSALRTILRFRKSRNSDFLLVGQEVLNGFREVNRR